MTQDELQNAIDVAMKGDLSAVAEKTFGYNLTSKSYQPRAGCLTVDYSSGEAVACSVLLAFYIEYHGTPSYLTVLQPRTWINSVVDLNWPGAFYFVSATNKLTDSASWDAIKMLLPGDKKEANP